MAQRGISKQRSSSCYQNKVNKITNWYNHLIEERKKNSDRINPNTKQPAKVRELRELQYYLDQIKKPKGE